MVFSCSGGPQNKLRKWPPIFKNIVVIIRVKLEDIFWIYVANVWDINK